VPTRTQSDLRLCSLPRSSLGTRRGARSGAGRRSTYIHSLPSTTAVSVNANCAKVSRWRTAPAPRPVTERAAFSAARGYSLNIAAYQSVRRMDESAGKSRIRELRLLEYGYSLLVQCISLVLPQVRLMWKGFWVNADVSCKRGYLCMSQRNWSVDISQVFIIRVTCWYSGDMPKYQRVVLLSTTRRPPPTNWF